MKRAADLGSLIMGIALCVSTFVGLTCVHYPDAFDIVSPRHEIAEAVKLEDDGSLPAITDEQLAKMDLRYFP